jgi:hypothetical protein
MDADQYGFIVGAGGYGAVNTRNLLRWIREDKKAVENTA